MALQENEREPEDKSLWLISGIMIFLGIMMVCGLGIGIAKGISGFLTTTSIGLLIGGAFFTAGGLGGFLFGIPKLIQNTGLVTDPTSSNASKTVIQQNDNLVQISDWLTKIIVGVGLTQLYNIPGYIFKIGSKFQHSFGDNDSGRNAVIAIILYFLVIGFLVVYIWTRIYFVRLLKDLDDDISGLGAIKREIRDNKISIEYNRLSAKIDLFERRKALLLNAENNFGNLKEIFKTHKPGPVRFLDDAQKGRWGGEDEKNGIKLDAQFKRSSNGTFENRTIYSVTLIVSGTTERPLTGNVYFFLHETFIPNHITMVAAENNLAETQIESYEACTVGAICQDGATMLELDLNLYPTTPEDYRYPEALMTIDQLYDERTSLAS